VVSASAYPEIRKAFLREGALDYIVKPFAASSFELVCNRLVAMFPELVRVSQPARRTATDVIENPETVTDRGH
jgi:response regulator of citrate/malate metabolism